MGNKTKVRKIERLLRDEYGSPPERRLADPLDVLIQTVLSQNTSDTNSHRAFQNLINRFGDWDAVRKAPVRQIERAIRVGGLAHVKGKRIKRMLSEIEAAYGSLSLRSICHMQVDEAMEALSRFDGVGPKTVHCVLLFACGKDVFPVDTHILRISKRVGLVPENTSLERAHQLWTGLLPRRLAYSLHLNLIAHGRRTCLARSPQCLRCCLRHICKYYLSIP